KNGLIFMGASPLPGAPFSSGLLCIASPVRRFPVANSGAGGSFAHGPGLGAFAATHFQPPFRLDPGTHWNFQTWFRDPNGACAGGDTNTSNALAVDFLP